MARRKKCIVCGSKRWHKSPSSGLITCNEGHVLQNYRNETTEVTELGPHHMRKRTLKFGKKKKERKSKADPKLYYGKRARFHYYQCLQLFLRMQVAALMRIWQLPPEFESVCKDIWALYLSLLPEPLDPETPFYPKDAQDQSSIGVTALERGSRAEDEDGDGHESEHDTEPEIDESSSSSSESEQDSELEELMKEMSATPSSSEQEDESGVKKPERFLTTTRKPKTFDTHDTPASTISVLVVACWTMRLPVMYKDFVKLIESYDLPYLDALRLIPQTMHEHLRKHTTQTLSPRFAPSTLRLHHLSSHLAKLMYTTYGIYTPELNASPVLWKAVRSLQGTPTLYVLSKRLARLVSLPITLHRILVPALERNNKRDPSFHKCDDAVPEVSLIATAIIVMKMVYGLDGQPRLSGEKQDPACALPTLKSLLRAMRTAEAAELKPVFSIEAPRSALDMDDTMLDEYLAFCEKALLPRQENTPRPNATTEQFPLNQNHNKVMSTHGVAGHSEDLHAGESSLAANLAVNEGHLHPGEQYAIYHTQDLLGSLPADLEFIISRSAQWAGVDDEYVSGVVERFERRVMRWWDREKRKERAERAGKFAPD